ncbi:MAG: hypothetical protein ABIS06_15155 [Vicinamibacterales bacterium]
MLHARPAAGVTGHRRRRCCLVNYRAKLPGLMKPLVTGALVVIAFSIYDLVGRAFYQGFMRLSISTICYLIVIGGLAALR